MISYFYMMIASHPHTKAIPQKTSDKEAITTSFVQVFEQYKGMLYAIALRMLGHGEDAKDAVQETFIKAYANLHTLKDSAALWSWLKSILCNHCLMELRCRKKRAACFNEYIREKELIEDTIHASEKAPKDVKNMLSDLSETLQLTTMLRFFSKHTSYEQIAAILSIPVGTVRSRLAESRVKLASLLTQYQPQKNNKARDMEDFYHHHFPFIYDNAAVRNAFLSHFDAQVFISLTSGKTKIGAGYMKQQIEFDLHHGSRATLTEVNSSGNISIIEITNINPADNPDLCPSATTFVAIHPHNKVERMFLHNAVKVSHWE
jgi:RNA polymerase sigma factor (sigma-70 family)